MEVNTITDNELKNEIMKQLEWDSRIDASQIKVEVQDGQVTLTGTTTCLFENGVIVNELSKIAGVKKIINNLNMVCITEEIPSDEEIEEKIETFLNIDSTIDTSNITIEVNRGVVYIKGTTNSFFQKKEVENAIYRVNGVRGVTNELAVLLTTKREDKEIAKKITHYIKKSLLAKIDQINVSVKDGDVVLEGCVPHWQVYYDIADFVKVTHGVKSVDNLLTIDPSGCK